MFGKARIYEIIRKNSSLEANVVKISSMLASAFSRSGLEKITLF